MIDVVRQVCQERPPRTDALRDAHGLFDIEMRRVRFPEPQGIDYQGIHSCEELPRIIRNPLRVHDHGQAARSKPVAAIRSMREPDHLHRDASRLYSIPILEQLEFHPRNRSAGHTGGVLREEVREPIVQLRLVLRGHMDG